MVLKTIKQSFLRSPVLCVFLSSIAAIACTVFAEESSYPKEASTDAMPADPMATAKDFLTNLSAPCEELLNASRLEEFHAMTLEATAKEARSIAEKAKNEDLTKQQTLKAMPAYLSTPSKNKSSKAKTGPKLIWKTADFLLRQLVPREARNRDRNKNSQDQSSASQPQAKISLEEAAAPLKYKAAHAKKKAEEAVIAAEGAESSAGKARAAANETRLSYEKCIGR